MSTATILYRARDRFTASANGVPRRKYPLPPDAPNQFAAYAFDQDFEQWMANFPPAPRNTPSNDAALGLGDANAILTSFSQPQDVKAGTGKFTGTFHIVPAPWNEFVTQAVTFPGIRDVIGAQSVRDPKTPPGGVTVRKYYEYFVIDPDALAVGVKDSAGNAINRVNDKGSIPVISATPWKFLYGGTIQSGGEVTGLVKAGGIAGWLETLPNTATYLAWAAVAAPFIAGTNSWTQTAPPIWDGTSNATTYGQYCFEDSQLVEYAGNIIARVSSYALPQ